MIGYNFSNIFTGQNNFHIYAQVTNLFTISKYSGLDPEIGRGGMAAGVDAGAWPTPRQYLFGLNIDF
jgi:TonB-dependent starch-binding outer membrane protein SusC